MTTIVYSNLPDVLFRGDINETLQITEVDTTLREISQYDLQRLLEFVSEEPALFNSFIIKYSVEGTIAPQNLIVLRGNKIREDISESSDGDNPDTGFDTQFTNIASFYVKESRWTDLAEKLTHVSNENEGTISIRYQFDKKEVAGKVSNCLNGSNVMIWSSERELAQWASTKPIKCVLDEFNQPNAPAIIYLENSTNLQEGQIPIASLDKLDEVEENWKAIQDQWEKQYSTWCSVGISHGPAPAPPEAFNTHKLREIFSRVFTYSTYALLADSAKLEDNILSLVIESNEGRISTQLNLSKWPSESAKETNQSLYDFFTKFAERGSIDVYRDLWQSAIASECNSLKEIPTHADQIEYYYENLEAEALKGNFEALSGAMQDAQIFIGDVTNTFTESTLNLSSEIQRLVLSLFGGIAVNMMIFILDAPLETSLSFTVLFSASLLLFYFPTVGARISEVGQVIEEGKEDTELYTEMAQAAGATKLVDTERLTERHESYIEFAKSRRDWAKDRLKVAFDILCLIWIISGGYSFIATPFTGIAVQATIASIPAAVWIVRNHREKDYFPESLFGIDISTADLTLISLVIFGVIGVSLGIR